MKTNRIMWGVVSLVVLITVAVSFGAFESGGREGSLPRPEITPTVTPWPVVKDTRDLSRYGSVDYSKAPEDLSAARILANKRYDNQGTWVFKSVHPVTAGVGRIRDDEPPPLFPTEESALVVLGEIIAAKAYLSNDKDFVYTEFTIRVEELLKNADSRKTGPKNVIADREGGVLSGTNSYPDAHTDSNADANTNTRPWPFEGRSRLPAVAADGRVRQPV